MRQVFIFRFHFDKLNVLLLRFDGFPVVVVFFFSGFRAGV